MANENSTDGHMKRHYLEMAQIDYFDKIVEAAELSKAFVYGLEN